MTVTAASPAPPRTRAWHYIRRLGRASSYAIAKGFGLPLVRREAVATGVHEMVFPYATYSPWLTDEAFQRCWRQVREHTLVDLWRCYELWQLVAEVRAVPGVLVEVGVWRGGTGALIAHRARSLGIEDPVYLCDTFTGVIKPSDVDLYYRGGEHADTSRHVVSELVERRLGLAGVEVLEGVFPDETGEALKDASIRLCHVDVDVYESARGVLEWVWPRLAPGGLVVFDDYGFASCPGITRLVDEQRGRADRVVVHNLNGHGILIKRAGG